MESVQYTLEPSQRRQAIYTPLFFVFVAIVMFVVESLTDLSLAGPWIGAAIGSSVAQLLVLGRTGAEVSVEGVLLKGVVTKRMYYWKDIRSIESRTTLGTTSIYLVTVSNGTERLYAPVTGLGQRDPEFDAKLAKLRDIRDQYGPSIEDLPNVPTFVTAAQS